MSLPPQRAPRRPTPSGTRASPPNGEARGRGRRRALQGPRDASRSGPERDRLYGASRRADAWLPRIRDQDDRIIPVVVLEPIAKRRRPHSSICPRDLHSHPLSSKQSPLPDNALTMTTLSAMDVPTCRRSTAPRRPHPPRLAPWLMWLRTEARVSPAADSFRRSSVDIFEDVSTESVASRRYRVGRSTLELDPYRPSHSRRAHDRLLQRTATRLCTRCLAAFGRASSQGWLHATRGRPSRSMANEASSISSRFILMTGSLLVDRELKTRQLRLILAGPSFNDRTFDFVMPRRSGVETRLERKVRQPPGSSS